MFGFKNNRKQEEAVVQRVQFLHEQDGISEQILKGDLNKFFTTVPAVDRAYLAIVSYNNRKSFDVALCLRAMVNTENEKQALVKVIGEIFAKLFKKDAHLDTLFLKDTQGFSLHIGERTRSSD